MELKTKLIKYNFIMNTILAVSSLVFPFITFLHITRVSLLEGTGRIAFLNTVVSYFSMFSMLGIPTYGIRACTNVKDGGDEFVRTVQDIWFINAVISIMVCFWTSNFESPCIQKRYVPNVDLWLIHNFEYV